MRRDFSNALIGLIILLLPFTPASSQVVINEVCSANDSVVADGDNSFEDWIEFYNAGNTAVNLLNYKIMYYEEAGPVSWTFPDVVIRPRSHLTVFASEKDRKSVFDHWEVPVFANDVWKYFRGTSEPDSNWVYPWFNDASWLQGPGGIGYGDGDDSTVIAPAASVYMRKTFIIADTSNIEVCLLLLDYDDAYVAYLNGVEISRSNIGVYGVRPKYNDLAYDEHEALGTFSGFAFVPKEILNIALLPGPNVFTIQTHNYLNGLDDLSSIPYFLTGVKDTSVTYYPIPTDGIQMHTNFTLSSRGHKLELRDPSGTIIDSKPVGLMQVNNSRGRMPDGSNNWCLFNTPTPNDTNDFSLCYSGYSSDPAISLKAGFYKGKQTTSISAPDFGVIRYTRDGSIPTAASFLYTTPVSIDSTQVLRAKLFPTNSTLLPGGVATNTYFINENVTLPVVSLSTNPGNLWDWNTGIYVNGPNADTIPPYQNANFWQDWERQCHAEYFDQQKKQGFELDAGIKIHGNFSRSWPQKSFRIFANDDYNDPWIYYNLFPEKPITRFKNFNIRNAGIDWNTVHFRDGLMHRIVRNTHIDIMDHKPCLLFLNGNYWGVYELREKQDKYYLENNHDVDITKIDLLRFDGDIMEGSNTGYFDMVNYVSSNDMSLTTQYDSVKSTLIDIENFADYFIAETYYANTDWIGDYTNNIKFWRVNNPPGKWRYILWDTDLGLGLFPQWGGDTLNMLNIALSPSKMNPHSLLLINLLKNTGFKNYFINRYADLINTIFHPINFTKKAYEIRDLIAPEMARHFLMWSGPQTIFGLVQVGRSVDVPTWNTQIDSMILFINNRPQIARDHIEGKFVLNKQVNVTLEAVPAGAGKIKISTIIPDSLPWTGVYFDGVPVTVTALPNPGYLFSHWQSPMLIQTPDKNTSVTLNINLDETLTAYFTPREFLFTANPNPFSKYITINYQLPKESKVSLKLISVIGQEVVEIAVPSVAQKEGDHTVVFYPESYNLADGIYFLEFRTDEFSKTIKVLKSGR